MVVVEAATVVVVVREYDGARDRRGVEAVERACEVGSGGGGKMCLFTDLLGDPLCRIRHSPAFLMLVRTYYVACVLGLPHAAYVVAAARRGSWPGQMQAASRRAGSLDLAS